MKALIIFMLFALVSCQNKTSTSSAPIEKVTPAEDESDLIKENFIFVPTTPGVKITGEKISKKDDKTFAENLQVIEASSRKTLDEFPLFDFGPVSFKDDQEKLTVYAVPEVLEIQYRPDDKKLIQKKAICNFTQKVDPSIVKQKIADLKSEKPAYDEIIEGLYSMAKNGSKEAFDFFVNPHAEMKEIHKKSESSASLEPMINVLKFMSKNECRW